MRLGLFDKESRSKEVPKSVLHGNPTSSNVSLYVLGMSWVESTSLHVLLKTVSTDTYLLIRILKRYQYSV